MDSVEGEEKYQKEVEQVLDKEKPVYFSPIESALILKKNYNQPEPLALYLGSLFYESYQKEIPVNLIEYKLDQYGHTELKNFFEKMNDKEAAIGSYLTRNSNLDSFLVTKPITYKNKAVSYRLFYKDDKLDSTFVMLMEKENNYWKLKGDWKIEDLPEPLLIKNSRFETDSRHIHKGPIYTVKQKMYNNPNALAKDYSSLIYQVYQGKKNLDDLHKFYQFYGYQLKHHLKIKSFHESLINKEFIPIESNLYEVIVKENTAFAYRSLKDENNHEFYFLTQFISTNGNWKILNDEITTKPDFLAK